MHDRKLVAVTSQTHEEVNDLEQFGRRECLEFQGLAWNKNEYTDDLILCVSKMVGVDLKAEEISVSHTVVCLRGGERGICLGPPLSGSPPLRYYVHKFSLFLVKDVLFTHVMRYKANHKQVFCFQRAPLQKL